MKPEIYQALSQLNSSFVQIVESLKALHGQGIVTGDYVHEHDVRLREIEKPRSFWENARQI